MRKQRTEYRVCYNNGYEVFKNVMKAGDRFDQLMAEKACDYCTLEKVWVDEKYGYEESEEFAGFEIDKDGEVIEW